MLANQVIKSPGHDEWCVLVHGAGGSSNVWFRQVREFSRHYNLLLIDLRGHGLSAVEGVTRRNDIYTFHELAYDVIEVLDHYQLRQCHFVGLSIGTIIIREIAEINPDYVRSMVLAGAVLRFDMRARAMAQSANALKRWLPYITIYKMYAWMIMPYQKHRNSRLIFINNALKITHKEFLNWMQLTDRINSVLKIYNSNEPTMPTLYVMGEYDYVFLAQVQLQLQKRHRNSFLHIIPDAGHICNIDNAEAFNAVALTFLKDICPHGDTTASAPAELSEPHLDPLMQELNRQKVDAAC